MHEDVATLLSSLLLTPNLTQLFSLVWYILAQQIIPYFKANISSFPTADRLTQICLYKFAASWLTEQGRQI